METNPSIKNRCCTSIGQALKQARVRLSALDEPHLEAELLLACLLRKPRAYLFTWPEKILTADQPALFEQLLSRRLAGEPLAYITGQREFWSIELLVSPATLIPRPETELLVEKTLALIPTGTTLSIADLGTGCGAVAAAIAKERPKCRITATDLHRDALSIAAKNFRRLELDNVICTRGDWFQALPPNSRFDLILSNPPYIEAGDPHLNRGGLTWEPQTALSAGFDGLEAIRRIVYGAQNHLRRGGWLLLEHGFDQGPKVRQLMQETGFMQICTHLDLEGRERVTGGKAFGL